MLSDKEIIDASNEYSNEGIWQDFTSFYEGALFVKKHYELEIDILIQKMNGYKERLAEIAGGIYVGRN